jgi:nucleolar MIF4G domain-containing protein 1
MCGSCNYNAALITLFYLLQDYVDACERLSQLNLTEVQQREIIRVILHCCGNVRYFHDLLALLI